MIGLAREQWKSPLSVIERNRRKSSEVAHTRNAINEAAIVINISGLEQLCPEQHLPPCSLWLSEPPCVHKMCHRIIDS